MALTGCAAPPPPPPPAVAVAPLPPAVDGRYRGTARLIRAERAGCPRSGARVLEVTGNAITLPYTIRPRQLGELTAEVQPDGAFQASDGAGALNGTLRGGQLEITISSAMCENHWSLRRVE